LEAEAIGVEAEGVDEIAASTSLIQTRHVSSNFLFLCFLVRDMPTACLFNSLLIPGDQMKTLRVVMVA